MANNQPQPRASLRPGERGAPRGIIDCALGWQAKWAALYIWNDVAGRMPGQYVTSRLAIGAFLGRSDGRTASAYLDEMVAVGFVHVIEDTRGRLLLDVRDPDQLPRLKRIDVPEQPLLFEIDDEPGPMEPGADVVAMDAAGRAGESTAEHFADGDFCAKIPGHVANGDFCAKIPAARSNDSPAGVGFTLTETKQLAALEELRRIKQAEIGAGIFAQKTPARGLRISDISEVSIDTKRISDIAPNLAAARPLALEGTLDDAAAAHRRRTEQLIDELLGMIAQDLPPGSRGLDRDPARKVIDVVLSGARWLDWASVCRIVDRARDRVKRERQPPENAVKIIIKSFQNQFAQHGVTWARRKPRVPG